MKAKIKICGMTDAVNISEVLTLKPDYMGFIFYSKSARYIAGKAEPDFIKSLSDKTITTGVFVDEPASSILETADDYGLRAVQLHGIESPQTCRHLKKSGLTVIKAFGISTADDLLKTKDYEEVADYFLFDTKTDKYGGSGQTFDWNTLNAYHGKTPFFISGGIDAGNITEAINTGCYAIDINSRFETSPGIKNAALIEETLNKLKLKQIQNVTII